jgi:hypothetical protein
MLLQRRGASYNQRSYTNAMFIASLQDSNEQVHLTEVNTVQVPSKERQNVTSLRERIKAIINKRANDQ